MSAMESAPTRVLVVANRTAATPTLLDEVNARARKGPCKFVLLIPDAGNRNSVDWTLERALPLMRRAAGRHVEGLVGGPDPFEAVSEAVAGGRFDEVIVSTLPRKVSRWLRRDLPRRIEGLGLPITVIEAGRRPGLDTADASLSLLTGVPPRGQ
jgi:hypothetical protein